MGVSSKIEWEKLPIGKNRVRTKEGYILIFCPNHPHAKSKGHIYEHRYVMENKLKRFLNSDEVVHHVNGDRCDNKIENLKLFTNSEHMIHHAATRTPEEKAKRRETARMVAKSRRKPRVNIKCFCGCGTEIETPDKKGRPKRYVQGHNNRGKNWKWRKHGSKH